MKKKKIKTYDQECESCHYKWESVSPKYYVTCPNCLSKTVNSRVPENQRKRKYTKRSEE